MNLPSTYTSDKKSVNAVIETPKNCAAKYNYDPSTQMFKLKKILPLGMVFPFHFGFLPHTKAEDGDPADVLVLMEEPAWPGCIIESTIIGVIEAEETIDGQTVRNDRFVASANASDRYCNLKQLSGLDDSVLKEMLHFFNNYNNLEKKEFKVIGNNDAGKAMKLLQNQIL